NHVTTTFYFSSFILFPMLYLALVLLIFALFFFRRSSTQRKEAGLPAGRIIYTDTHGWGKVEKPLFYSALELSGKPDYLVQQNGKIVPVEVKSGRAPEAPYDSHIYQLAAYCLLVEKTYNIRPPHGIIHYENRDFAIDYTRELESALVELLADLRADDLKGDFPRSHEQASRCKRCGFRNVCDQSLV
ncbi:MAG: CRISPR-associated protein Cas4, partial [Anaerolineales bacterium]|nr:CRISPR-associated protein Cas4 [Anaerolineales bacterium]